MRGPSNRVAILQRFGSGAGYIAPPGWSGTAYPSTYDPPGAQFGAFVRGVNNPFGRLIRVGENNTDEVIMPLRDLMSRFPNAGRNRAGANRDLMLMLNGQVFGRAVIEAIYDNARIPGISTSTS